MYPHIFQFLPTEFQIMMGNGVVVGSVAAVVLNLLFNGYGKEKLAKD